MNRNIITAADAARQQKQLEAKHVKAWIPVFQSMLNENRIALGKVAKDPEEQLQAEYCRGSIDTLLHILVLIERAYENE